MHQANLGKGAYEQMVYLDATQMWTPKAVNFKSCALSLSPLVSYQQNYNWDLDFIHQLREKVGSVEAPWHRAGAKSG